MVSNAAVHRQCPTPACTSRISRPHARKCDLCVESGRMMGVLPFEIAYRLPSVPPVTPQVDELRHSSNARVCASLACGNRVALFGARRCDRCLHVANLLDVQPFEHVYQLSAPVASDEHIKHIDHTFFLCSRCKRLQQFTDLPTSPDLRSPVLCLDCYPLADRALPLAFWSQRSNWSPLDLGRMDVVCKFCNALHWRAEALVKRLAGGVDAFGRCCRQGAIKLPLPPNVPPLLHSLLSGTHPKSNHFLSKIHLYNASLAFASMKYTPDNRVNGYKPNFAVKGSVYHMHGPIEPPPFDKPSFCQLYFCDQNAALDFRSNFDSNRGMDSELLQGLDAMIREHNNLYKTYRTAHQVLSQRDAPEELRLMIPRSSYRLLTLEDGVIDPSIHRGRQNAPAPSQFGILIPREHEQSSRRDVILYRRRLSNKNSHDDQPLTEHLEFLHNACPFYMSLHYVLLFPHGRPGWDIDMIQGGEGREQSQLSMRMYHRFHLFVRRGVFPVFHLSRWLFQQFLVDCWAAVEGSNLDFLRHNQSCLRMDTARSIQEAVNKAGPSDFSQRGTSIVLPSTFSGSDRNMQQNYQDSMAVVRELVHPTLFITFTANPYWPEIQRELLPGQKACDRPDIVVRVFMIKMGMFLEDIKKKHVFGKFRGWVWTIEFQKRGLPHLHLLLFLANRSEYLNAEYIDRVVLARFPDEEDPYSAVISDLVSQHMIHGPCGAANPNSPCMVNGRCKRHYPRAFSNTTLIPGDGYPKYKRPSGYSRFCTRDRTITAVDNSMVVPYNPYLLWKYQAHINVEVCGSIRAVKYIHKYIYKGSDFGTVQVLSPGEKRDEIREYLSCRYISATEAVVRLMEYHIHEEYPPVKRLQFHLENEYHVIYSQYALEPEILEKATSRRTQLMGWFDYNANNIDGRHLLYLDFPKEFVWIAKRAQWQKRKQKTTRQIGRLYHTNPTSGEIHYLRMLLITVAGATSYRDLRTFNSVTYRSFKEACRARGLLRDEHEWKLTFEEAILFKTGFQLRRLLIIGIHVGGLTEVAAIWDRFKESLTDDLIQKVRQFAVALGVENAHHDYGLYLLHKDLVELDCRSIGSLPQFTLPWETSKTLTRQHGDLINFDISVEQALAASNVDKLNAGQKIAYWTIINAIENDPGSSHFFLHGAGGTGKTFLYKTLCATLRSQNKIVICVASSGIASLLLPGGRTSHSRFKLPLDINESSTAKIHAESEIASIFRIASLLIWDEVTMQHRHCFETVHRLFCDLRNDKSSLYGGIPVIFGGDFAQILPVIRHGTRAETVSSCIKYCSFWPKLRHLHLWQNMRLNTDPTNLTYGRWIWNLSYKAENQNKKIVLPSYISVTYNKEEFQNHVFKEEDVRAATKDPRYYGSRAILCVLNDDLESHNNHLMTYLPGEIVEFTAIDTLDEGLPAEAYQVYTPEVMRRISIPGFSLPVLKLSVGTPLMLLRNIDPAYGLCNGTRMVLLNTPRHVLHVRVVTGDHAGTEHFIPRIDLYPLEHETLFPFKRHQFPVQICFAMTVNKSQGQSLQVVGLDLTHQPFSHGQLYVALSRITDVRCLKVLLPENSNGIDNVVYPEALNEIPTELMQSAA